MWIRFFPDVLHFASLKRLHDWQSLRRIKKILKETDQNEEERFRYEGIRVEEASR